MAEVSGGPAQQRPPREGSKRANGAEPHLRWLADRQRRFRELFDFGSGKGLEIGPLDTPAVDALLSAVSYVDVYDRAGVIEKYRDDDNVLLELIPETTFPLWDGAEVRPLAEVAAAGAPFDWVVASHVVEHVPDLVSWLADITRLTTADGALVLAVPDRRFTFDCHRPPTTTGQVIDAYLRGDLQPSPRAVYDGQSAAVSIQGSVLRPGMRPPGRTARMDTPLAAFEAAKRALEEYVDAHVWTFSVPEFVELIRELRELGLSNWYVARIAGDQRSPDFEFLTVLRKVPSDGSDFVEIGFDSDLPAWLTEQWQLRETAQQLSSQLAQAVELLNKLTGGDNR
jgi:SAM-dependent methyltransferase